MFMCLAYFLSIVNNSNNKDLNYYIAKYIIENINHIGSITYKMWLMAVLFQFQQ